MTEYEIIQTLSGTNEFNKPKVGILLLHELIGSDNSIQPVDEVYIEKPELKIYRDDSIIRLDFVYEFPDDQDLLQQYMFFEKFYQPQNSMNFTAEDLQFVQLQQNALDLGRPLSDETVVLYDNTLTLNIISLEPKGKYTLTSVAKPIFYNLVPLRPNEPATIFRVWFNRNDILIQEETDEDVSAVLEAVSRDL